MEILKEQIEKFLCNNVQGDYSDGYDDGYDDSGGYGGGYGNDNGKGYGGGYGYGYGNGEGDGNGNGYGGGYGKGNGYNDCRGYGKGNGCGDGCSYDDNSIAEINGYQVCDVDNVRTLITSIHDNFAKGYIVEKNTKLVPCYIAKEDNKFAHGITLREAFSSLQEKLYDDSTEEERLEAFKKKFPCYDEKYDNKDLFTYHHVLTGSCKMGRESFVNDKGLSLEGKTTVREFVALTKDAYGGSTIKKLPKVYGITD